MSRYDQPIWCEECGVSLDMHDGPDSCEWAELRAEAIARAEWALFQGILR